MMTDGPDEEYAEFYLDLNINELLKIARNINESFVDICNRITSGNVPHQKAMLKYKQRMLAGVLEAIHIKISSPPELQ